MLKLGYYLGWLLTRGPRWYEADLRGLLATWTEIPSPEAILSLIKAAKERTRFRAWFRAGLEADLAWAYAKLALRRAARKFGPGRRP